MSFFYADIFACMINERDSAGQSTSEETANWDLCHTACQR